MKKILSKRALIAGVVAVAVGGAVAIGLNVNSARAAAIGAQAPAFSVTDATGATRTLAEFAGKTVVLEWTNKDCPFVRRHYNSHNMQNLQREAEAQGVVWLSVVSSAPGEQGYVSGAQALANAQAVGASPTAILLDPDGVMGHAYGATNTPHMYIINPQGQLVYQGAIDSRSTANPSTGFTGVTNYVEAALDDLAAGRPVAHAQTRAYGCSVKYSG